MNFINDNMMDADRHDDKANGRVTGKSKSEGGP